MVTIGDAILFVDEFARPRPALVTAVWRENPHYSPTTPAPGVNLVIVSEDPAREDTYGRQITRETSVVHATNQPAHGCYWRRLDEEPKASERPRP